jgi:hypothetical protein
MWREATGGGGSNMDEILNTCGGGGGESDVDAGSNTCGGEARG